MHSLHWIHLNNCIYQRAIYREISLELRKIRIRQGLPECALTYNVTALDRLPLGKGARAHGHARRVSLGQALPASWLVIKACQRAAPHHSLAAAKLRKHPPRTRVVASTHIPSHISVASKERAAAGPGRDPSILPRGLVPGV